MFTLSWYYQPPPLRRTYIYKAELTIISSSAQSTLNLCNHRATPSQRSVQTVDDSSAVVRRPLCWEDLLDLAPEHTKTANQLSDFIATNIHFPSVNCETSNNRSYISVFGSTMFGIPLILDTWCSHSCVSFYFIIFIPFPTCIVLCFYVCISCCSF